MTTSLKKRGASAKGALGAGAARSRLQLAAVGLEAEFSLVVDGAPARPEDVFGNPRAFIREPLVHREGTSYHLPTGGAVYFDTGVIEVATPVIEIERGCAARAGRSLWEGILFIRRELDAWERRTGRHVRLVGFSTHYNISFELPRAEQGRRRTIDKLARLLVHVLPVPVMLLATNRRSTGVGVRPRGDRIEVTVDFTPSPALMIATATIITGIVRRVMSWPTFELDMLDRIGLPVVRDFQPMPHTSRKGWLAREDGYARNPFASGADAPLWLVRDAFYERLQLERRPLTLRQIARYVIWHFRPSIARLSDPFTFRLIHSILAGRAPSLLDLPDRPPAYEDVGRLCFWDNLFPESVLSRSRYERVLIRAISGKKLILHGERFTPTGLRGWSEVVFRRDRDGTRHVYPIDYLLNHLDAWERDGLDVHPRAGRRGNLEPR